MAFDWFFKRNFRGGLGQDIIRDDDDDDPDFVDKSSDERFHKSFDVPFIDPFGTLEDTSHDMFQRMDDMLSRMFSSTLTFGAENFSDGTMNDEDPRSLMLKDPDSFGFNNSSDSTRFETREPTFFIDSGVENFSDGTMKEKDPRSLMLKDPDSFGFDILPGSSRFKTKEPAFFVDSDIDDQVAKHGSLWKGSLENNAQPNFSYKKFSSIRTVRLPDGSMEEHRSVSDNDGNVTTVRRTIGEQSHEITTHSDAKGLKEKHEIFTNLDESDLHEFEKRWQNKKRTEQESVRDMFLKSPTGGFTPPTGDPAYSTLFKKFFGI